VLDHVSTQ